SLRASLRARRVPVARGGRRLVAALGRARVSVPLAGDLGGEPARRQPLPGWRLADLHDLRLDADLRSLEPALGDRRARQAAADADLRPADRAAAGRPNLDLPTASPAGQSRTSTGAG